MAHLIYVCTAHTSNISRNQDKHKKHTSLGDSRVLWIMPTDYDSLTHTHHINHQYATSIMTYRLGVLIVFCTVTRRVTSWYFIMWVSITVLYVLILMQQPKFMYMPRHNGDKFAVHPRRVYMLTVFVHPHTVWHPQISTCGSQLKSYEFWFWCNNPNSCTSHVMTETETPYTHYTHYTHGEECTGTGQYN